MKFKNIFLLIILMNLFCYSNLVHSSSDSDDEDDKPIQRIIKPIDIDGCRAIADAISDDSAQDYFENLDPEEDERREQERHRQVDWFFRATPSTPVIESEEQKTARLQKEEEQRERSKERIAKLEEKFMQDERKIYEKALSMLCKHPAKRKEYKVLIQDQNLWPSIAIWELTKDISTQPYVLALLELIEDYSQDEYAYYYGYEQDVGLKASDRIFSYYLEEYNKRASDLPNPKEMDRNVHDLLQLCCTHMPTHPMSGVDDPECTMCHISGAVHEQLLTLNLWYVDNPKLIRDLVDLYSLQRLFTLGVRFLECTTYGVMPQYFDLGYLLKRKKFVGIKMPCPKAPDQHQHIWVHPYMPFQVRITEKGKLTVGLLRKNPLTADKQLVKSDIKEDNELYKISTPGFQGDIVRFSGHIVPARHLEAYQEFWAKGLDGALKNYLVDEAHAYLDPRDMDFLGMEKLLCKEPETKKAKKKK